ncbi:hypothetical protein ACU60U_24985 [Klebsiella aerogenes]
MLVGAGRPGGQKDVVGSAKKLGLDDIGGEKSASEPVLMVNYTGILPQLQQWFSSGAEFVGD